MVFAIWKPGLAGISQVAHGSIFFLFMSAYAFIGVALILLTRARRCLLHTERKTVVVEERLLGMGIKQLAPLDKVDIYCFKKPTTHFFAIRRYCCTLFTESAAVVLCVAKTPERAVEYAETLPPLLRERVVSLIDE